MEEKSTSDVSILMEMERETSKQTRTTLLLHLTCRKYQCGRKSKGTVKRECGWKNDFKAISKHWPNLHAYVIAKLQAKVYISEAFATIAF